MPVKANGFTKKSGQIYISGRFTDKKIWNDSLEVSFWPHFIYGVSKGGSVAFMMHIDEEGRFKLILPPIAEPGRLRVANYRLGMILFEWQLVEPGDNFNIIIGKDETIVTGKGASKYGLKIQSSRDISTEVPLLALSGIDSMLSNNLYLLSEKKTNISKLAYNIIKSDIIGEAYSGLLRSLYVKNDAIQNSWKPILEDLEQQGFLQDLKSISAQTLSMSTGYINYIFAKSKIDAFKGGPQLTFNELFHHIHSSYNGILREKLLTYLFADYPEILGFGGIDADTFTTYLRSTFKMVKTDYLKKALQKQISSIGKNAIAYDFRLPDSAGHYINLHDFRGKAVLIDIWITYCGGCLAFKKEFDSLVYPSLKDNHAIKIVSICGDKNRNTWQKSLPVYSNYNYINLYTGGKGFSHPLIDYYNIVGVPYFLLIDKKGKIFSATIPYLRKSQNLLALLNEVSGMPD